MARPRAVLLVDPTPQKDRPPADVPTFFQPPAERKERSYKHMPMKRAATAMNSNRAAKRQRKELVREIYRDTLLGRETTYSGEAHDNMLRSMRFAGCTRDQIAAAFAIKVTTLDQWLLQYPAFKVAWLEGGDVADGMVASRLWQRAMGFKKKCEKIFCNKDGEVTRVEYDEYYPPDVGACNIWLTNRQTQQWKNRRANEITGANGEPLAPVPITVLPVVTAPPQPTPNPPTE